MNNQDFIINIFEKLFLGFGLITLLAIILSFFKLSNLREFLSKFINTSIKLIRILGIIYFFYYLIRFIIFYSSNEVTLFNERAVGPYAWAYWYMILRPFIFCFLVQLFWIEKVQNTKWLIFFNTLVIFLIVFGSGVNFERFVVLISSYHRDYFPNKSIDNSIIYYPFILIFSLIENIVLFLSLVFITWFINGKIKIKP